MPECICVCTYKIVKCCKNNKDDDEDDEEIEIIPMRRRITRQITRQIINSPKHQTIVEMNNIKSINDNPGTPRRRKNTALI